MVGGVGEEGVSFFGDGIWIIEVVWWMEGIEVV